MTDRISRDELYATVARAIARRSTCARAQVGVVIVRDRRMVMTGYNGTPAGMPHCDHTCTCVKGKTYLIPVHHESDCPTVLPCTRAVHAEANAIAWAAREGVALQGSLLVTTLSPCVPCAQLIISAGIRQIMYLDVYRDQSGLELLIEAGL